MPVTTAARIRWVNRQAIRQATHTQAAAATALPVTTAALVNESGLPNLILVTA